MNRILHLARNIFRSNFGDLRFPYRLTFILTYACQLRCSMCNIWKRPGGQELSLFEIDRFFAAYGKFNWINLSGGEIFLRPDLPDVIGCINKRCRQLSVLDFPTNGFQTRRIVETIRRLRLTLRIPQILVTVSLDGPRQVHDRLRGVEGSWENAVETYAQLRKFNSRNFHVFLGYTLQPENVNAFPDAYSQVKERVQGVAYNDFHINIMHGSIHYYGTPPAERGADEELWQQLLRISNGRRKRWLSPVEYLERRYQRGVEGYLRTGRMPYPCQALSASLFLDPYGDVYPCSIYNARVGNIRDCGYDLKALWQQAARARLREEIKEGKCPGCWTPCEAYQAILGALLKC